MHLKDVSERWKSPTTTTKEEEEVSPQSFYVLQVFMPWEPTTAMTAAVLFYQRAARSSKSECRRERWLRIDSIVDTTGYRKFERLGPMSVWLPLVLM